MQIRTTPITPRQSDFLGSAQGSIPFSDGLVPFSETKPGDIVALNTRFRSACPESNTPDLEPEKVLVEVSVRTETGFDPRVDLKDLTPEQLAKCSAAFLSQVARTHFDAAVWDCLQIMGADGTWRRPIVFTHTAHIGALILTDGDLVQDGIDCGDFEDPERIGKYIQIILMPSDSAHERLALQAHYESFLDYVSRTFLTDDATGTSIHPVLGPL